jgi:hypothetical protein
MTRFRTYRHFVLLGILGLWLVINTESAADTSFAAQASVYFSPRGGCTEVIVRELVLSETAPTCVCEQRPVDMCSAEDGEDAVSTLCVGCYG